MHSLAAEPVHCIPQPACRCPLPLPAAACKVVARSQGPSCPFCRGPIASFQLLPGARQGQQQHQEQEQHSQQEKQEQQCQTAYA